MREVKFRFYSKNVEDGRISVSERSLEDIEGEDSWQGANPWRRIATCEYTGLKDKNGVEIYQGDIIKNYHQLFSINWYGLEARLMPFTTSAVDEGNHFASAGVPISDWNWINCIDTSDPDWRNKPHKYGAGINFHDSAFGRPEACEVIGNIYQNPELLSK